MVHDSKSATNPLGETLASPAAYAPEILFPIPRAPAREAIGFPPQLAMFGFDHCRLSNYPGWIRVENPVSLSLNCFLIAVLLP